MKLRPQVHALDDPYHQEDIRPDALLGNKARSPFQYKGGDNMSYSDKKALKQLPEASIWPKSSGTREHDHRELVEYIDELFIDIPSLPDYCITARLNTEFQGQASVWYTELKENHGGRVRLSKSTEMVLGYGKRPCHLKVTITLWKKIHMSGVLESLKDLKPLILKMNINMRNHKVLKKVPGELEHALK
ncbi:hypothetical protein O181_054614 [Austropuccinia psidii MF-1]|uniref:Uncharacterized protein n=1 Tax=Austropuccinia psidii MF-1 TaxID=1389203 RepID=A0A9Q3HTU3_9BASI|nr:hypothetical protein [Austropuccinia psidii MF-1]